MENFIKEIEVGGVRHSITLADGVIGSGLKREENGALSLKVATTEDALCNSGLAIGYDGALGVDTYIVSQVLAGSGLTFNDGKIKVRLYSGGPLTLNGGRLTLSGAELAGNGLWAMPEGYPLEVRIAKRTSGLRLFFNSIGELDVTQD